MKNDLISRFEIIDLFMQVFKQTTDIHLKLLCCTFIEATEKLHGYGQAGLPLKQGEFCPYCGAAKVDKK